MRTMGSTATDHDHMPVDPQRRWRIGPGMKPFASAAVRSGVLIAIATLLIVVLLPAALVAAGT